MSTEKKKLSLADLKRCSFYYLLKLKPAREDIVVVSQEQSPKDIAASLKVFNSLKGGQLDKLKSDTEWFWKTAIESRPDPEKSGKRFEALLVVAEPRFKVEATTREIVGCEYQFMWQKDISALKAAGTIQLGHHEKALKLTIVDVADTLKKIES